MEWTIDRVGPGLNQHEADALGVAPALPPAKPSLTSSTRKPRNGAV
jgi:hypothetical protein